MMKFKNLRCFKFACKFEISCYLTSYALHRINLRGFKNPRFAPPFLALPNLCQQVQNFSKTPLDTHLIACAFFINLEAVTIGVIFAILLYIILAKGYLYNYHLQFVIIFTIFFSMGLKFIKSISLQFFEIYFEKISLLQCFCLSKIAESLQNTFPSIL